MLKLILSVTVLWTFFSQAAALDCLSCNGTCSTETTVTCSTETMCVTATITETSIFSADTTKIHKGCASSDLCPITGSQTYELNLGVSGALISAECCNFDGCNNDTLPAHTRSPTPNGLSCFSCIFGRCDGSIVCKGDETLCIQGTLNEEIRGCVSPSVCPASRRLGELPLLPDLGTFSSGPNCCDTDECNDGTTTTPPPTTTTTPPTTTTTPPTTTTTPPTTTPGGLKCLSCTGSCSTETTVTCSTETMCVTATITDTALGSSDPPRFHKGCASSDLCPITGSQTYELNLGLSGALISVECCNFDGCNNNTLPAHTQSQTLNGLHCFFCGFGRCDVSFDCKGDETLCIQGTLNEDIRGCASPSVCTASRRLGEIPLLPELGTFSSGPNCCDTENCNDGSTTTTPPTTTTTPPTTTTTPPTTTTTPPTTTTTPPTTTTTPPTTTTTPPTTTPGGLQCLSCTGSCSTETTVTCSTETMCVTATITDRALGSSDPPRYYKGCASSDLCPITGSQTYELNLGVSGALISAECCDTDGCNNNTLPAHTQSEDLNGLHCFFCGFSRCDVSFDCRGDETLCIQGTLNEDIRGCASPSVCTASRRLGEIPLLPELGTFSSGPNCCDTNECNDGTTTTTPPTTTTTPPTTTTTPPTTTTTPPTTTTMTPPNTGLQCLSCSDSSCSSPESVTCSSETMCITASIKDLSSGEESFFRGCAPPTLCPHNGTFKFSTDVVESHKIIDAECCDTNNCNSETLTVPVQQAENGLDCFFCISVSNSCSFTVHCEGAQDRCFDGYVSTDTGVQPVAGCTSTDVCEIAPDHGVLPFMEGVGNLTSGPTCCGTNHCNDFTEPTTAGPTTTPMSTTVPGLQCLSCSGSSCSSPVSVTCSSETMCVTASIKDLSSGDESFFRGCAPPTLCPHNGTFKFSTDVVDSYKIIDAECCDTNNCNSETLTVPVQQAENGLDCFFCISVSNSCSFTVHCEGAQDRCFDGYVSTDNGVQPVAGCTSTDVCEIAPDHGVLPFMEGVGNLTSGPTCCGTNHCNDFTEPTTAGPTTTPIITTVPGLQCLSCSGSSCSSPVSVTCSSETMCVTASIKDVLSEDESFFRGCAPPTLCPHNGTFNFSTDVVDSYKIIDAECCDTNNCNSETLTVPVQQAENGLDCFFCISGSNSCSFTVHCEGAQDRCFDGYVSTDNGVQPVAGCTSTDVCEIAPDHGVLPFMEGVGNLTSGPTCCGTNHCNDFTEPTTAGPTTTPISTTVPRLQCLSCSGSSCSSPVSVTCSSETMCVTASIKDVLSGDESFFRGCAPPTLCPHNGTFKFSTDVVESYKIIDAECCDTNNCNSETLTVPVQQAENVLDCFFCISGTDICVFTVHCEGAQDRCFDGYVSTDNRVLPVAGCTSTDVCEIAPDHGVLPFMEGVGNLTSGPTCCETNHCNDFTEPTTAGPTPTPMSTTVPGLQCLSCSDSSCSSPESVTCSSETMCVTASIKDVLSGDESFFRGCAPPTLCPHNGTFRFSTDVVDSYKIIDAECCDTNNCNSEFLPVPVQQAENGLQCFFCISGSNSCSFTVHCEGAQDRCFDGHVSTDNRVLPVAGCTSTDVCEIAPDHGVLPFMEGVGNLTSGPTCCGTNHCNDFTEPTTAGPTTTPMSTTVPGLQCLSCSDSSCSSPVSVSCSSETMCVTASIKDVLSEEASFFRGCAPPTLCPHNGTFKFSTDVVDSYKIIDAECCDTNNCNSETLTVPVQQVENGLQCFFCISGSNTCSFTVHCEGAQDRCFDGHVSTDNRVLPVAGCTSTDVCEIAPDHGVLPFMEGVGNLTSGPTCCGTNHCNDFTEPTTAGPTTTPMSTTVPGLQCLSCSGSSCSSPVSVTCSSETMCITASIKDVLSGEESFFRGCAPPTLCPHNGTFKFSTDVVDSYKIIDAECCDTNNCNSETLTVPVQQAENGLQCFFCISGSNSCSFTVHCEGAQDRCFDGHVSTDNRVLPVAGCTSTDVCEIAPDHGVLPFMEGVGNLTSGPTCCGTNHCNDFTEPTTAGPTTTPMSTTVPGFQCLSCSDSSCSSPVSVTCSSETMCITASIKDVLSGEESFFRGCAPPTLCPHNGTFKFSTDVVDSYKIIDAECCDTNNCNSETLTVPVQQVENGLQCFFCISGSNSCSFTVHCEGAQDRCFDGHVSTDNRVLPVAGCTSTDVCEIAPDHGVLPFMEGVGNLTSGPTCCGTNHCNDFTEPTTAGPTTTPMSTTGLQCLSCSGSSCSSPVSMTCSSETMCITASIKDVLSGDESFFRGCAPPTLCPHNGTFRFSTDVVDSDKIIDAECCDTNNCNSETLTVPVQQAENGLQCFFCISGSNSCSFTVHCEGAQDRCFDGHVSTDNRVLPVAGCTSTDVCEIAPDHGVLPFMEGVGNLTSGPTCCGTNHCNDFTEPTTAGPTTAVPGLQCLSCSDSSCSSPVSVTCSSETMCITASIKDVVSEEESFFRGCAPPTLCPHNGTFKFSTDVVDSDKIIDAECCDTNNCNSETLPVPVQQVENGLQCFFCISGSNSCSFTVHCEGAQDRCFDGHVSTDNRVLPVAGCTSTDVCEIAPDHGVLPFMEGVGNLTSGPTCCGTNHCNDFTEPTTAGPTTTPMSTTVPGLQCLSCSGSSCSSPVSVTCSSETMCITASIKDVLSGDESFFRGCAPPTLCPHNGTFKFSTDVVDSYKIIDAECCDTNNCNSETLTVPVQQAENGLQCFFCISGTDICSFTVQCEGAQDHCFDGHVSTDNRVLPVAGCTSTDVCEIAPDHGVLPFMEGVGNLTSGPTCCGTNHCNDFTEPTTAGPTTTP
ncbi:mucin-19-like isoform X7 [Gouania willdenowi]|uniref:mucin-19-like isoform X7 n=1 Tax=Gouania willdenowi TaxID=441366 RepID=UPI0010551284|nr:mucin-19-like isoform X7 [Gouania willdenowi]